MDGGKGWTSQGVCIVFTWYHSDCGPSLLHSRYCCPAPCVLLLTLLLLLLLSLHSCSLQYDNCYASDVDLQQRYSDMRDALNKTGRPI